MATSHLAQKVEVNTIPDSPVITISSFQAETLLKGCSTKIHFYRVISPHFTISSYTEQVPRRTYSDLKSPHIRY